MKKIIAILVLLFNVVFLNAQTKPTKQETIDWITAKIRENSIYNSNNTTYDYAISEDYEIEVTKNDHMGMFKISFSFNDICNVRINRQGGRTIYIGFKSPATGRYDDGSSAVYNQYLLFFESEIAERMLKALKTLAEYNCPPVKDIF